MRHTVNGSVTMKLEVVVNFDDAAVARAFTLYGDESDGMIEAMTIDARERVHVSMLNMPNDAVSIVGVDVESVVVVVDERDNAATNWGAW